MFGGIQMWNNKIVKNASWIVGCKIAQSVLSFIVTMLTARFLGPSNYGLVSYAASIVAFVAPIVQLGLGNIQVQELVNDKESEGKIVGTTLCFSLFSAIFCYIGIISFAMIANASEQETIIVCALYGIILFFQGAELLQYWFQANYLSKYASIVSLIAFFLVTIYRVILLIIQADIYLFAVANAIDYFVILLALLFVYKYLGGKQLSFSFTLGRKMLAKSRYYIVANMMVAIFSQADRIMLKLMVDDAATGIYSAAMSCAGLANFVFIAIIDSFRPLIFENYKISREKFENSISQLYSIIIYLSLAECIVVTVFSKYIIGLIYGEAYFEAIAPLQIGVWYSTFSFIGNIRNIWILAEGKQRWVWIINLSGVLANVVGNLFLIPIWGVTGAAFASLVTQIFANVFVSYLISDTRPNTKLMLKGLNPKLLFGLIEKMKKN